MVVNNIQKVKGAFELPIQTVTIIPSTKDKTRKVSDQEFRRRTLFMRRWLAKTFGGYTEEKAIGGYLLKGKEITEDVIMITSFSTEKDFKKNKTKWISKIKQLKKQWGQDSMGIIIENDLLYV